MPSAAHSSTIFLNSSKPMMPCAPMHLVARAEHALRVADVGALDLDDLGQRGRAIAPGREQQPPDRLRLRGAARLARRPRRATRLDACQGIWSSDIGC